MAQHLQSSKPTHQHVESSSVLNMVNRVMKLTRGKLLKQPDWHDWQDWEYLQLNQYFNQGMFGSLQLVDEDAAVFHNVWTYAIAAPDERMANILLDLIDDELSIPMKRQGYLDMYNGIDVIQTRDYIKISSTSFIDKICKKYLNSWMQNFMSTEDRPTHLPTDPTWFKKFNAAVGDSDPKVQAKLAKKMQLTYRCGVGELIWI